MDKCGTRKPAEKVSGGADAKGVEHSRGEEPTPAASSCALPERLASSAGESAEREQNVDRSNGNKYKTLLIKNCGRLESGSGSGDQDGGQHEDTAAKKRKTRRGKPKHRKLKPYLKRVSHQQRLRSQVIGRKQTRLIAKTNRQPPALYNTTQFLMEDHSDLPDLEQKLSEAASLEVCAAMFQKPPAAPRTRDSSFSVDSDENYFYSSPEDEEEFLTKEFSTAYEDLHEERLSTLTKTDLIQEYRHLEAKMDLLTKRLRNKNISQMEERDSENKNVSDSEMTKKLKLYQQRIDELIQQNEQLRRENEMLRTEKRLCVSSSESSVDSESDSDSSSSSNQACSYLSPETSPKHNFKSRLDNSIRTDKKNDSCDTSQSGSPKTSVTPSTFSNKHMVMNEASMIVSELN